LPTRLHLGCGLKTPPGWLNVDGSWQVVLARHPILKRILVATRLFPKSQADIPWSANVMRVNLASELPFEKETFEAIYCSHTLEHLYHRNAEHLLQECWRVLKPGGVCRVVVPDLGAIIERYLQARQMGEQSAADRLMEELLVHEKHRKPGIMGIYYRLTGYHQHKWMYDALSLQRLFNEAGFTAVKAAEYGVSRIDNILEIEEPGRIMNGQGVAVEGSKPGQ